MTTTPLSRSTELAWSRSSSDTCPRQIPSPLPSLQTADPNIVRDRTDDPAPALVPASAAHQRHRSTATVRAASALEDAHRASGANGPLQAVMCRRPCDRSPAPDRTWHHRQGPVQSLDTEARGPSLQWPTAAWRPRCHKQTPEAVRPGRVRGCSSAPAARTGCASGHLWAGPCAVAETAERDTVRSSGPDAPTATKR